MWITIPNETLAVEAQERRDQAARKRRARQLRADARGDRSVPAPRFPRIRIPARHWLPA